MSRNKTKRGWPDTACCEDCGEYFWPTLRKPNGIDFRCHNCDDTRHRRGKCTACQGNNLPLEGHHVAMRRNDPDWVVDVCLNCHAELTQRQLAWNTRRGSHCELGLNDMHEIGERRRQRYERIKLTSATEDVDTDPAGLSRARSQTDEK